MHKFIPLNMPSSEWVVSWVNRHPQAERPLFQAKRRGFELPEKAGKGAASPSR